MKEVGITDAGRSETLDSGSWIRAVNEDLEAGAALVITEAPESGHSGICHADGQLRPDLVDDILASGIDPNLLLFEPPTKVLQTEFLTRLGTDDNLGNIAAGGVIGVETLRLGLLADSFMHFERAALHA